MSWITDLMDGFRRQPAQSAQFRKTVKDLKENIAKLESQGYAQDEIVKKLAGAGWREHIVDLVLHEVHDPNSGMEKLEGYVQKQRMKAVSPEVIKETLLDAGWNEDLVDAVLGL